MDQSRQTELAFKSVRSQPDMSEVFDEGGITDDGLAVDPISGNEIPAGSMAEEVRDDIPAQLSGGEYVVPADVLRFYGVKFFEELRAQAKMGLSQMEGEGRIGGEPIGMEGDEQPLSMEEEAELNAIMGMAMGGLIGEPYSAPVASAPNPNNPTSPMYDPMANTAMQNNNAGYAVGGEVPANTQVNFPDFSKYKAGNTFMDQQAAAPTPDIAASKNVTLYGPNGEVVLLILPGQQTQYDELIAQGYSTQPTTVTSTFTPTGTSKEYNPLLIANNDIAPDVTKSRELDDSRFGSPELTAMIEDPLAYGASQINGGRFTSVNSRTAGLAGSLLGGPIGGIIGGTLGSLNTGNNIAEARAASLMAEHLGYDNTALEASISQYVGGLKGLEKRLAEGALERGTPLYNSRLSDAQNPDIGGGLARSDLVAGEAGDQQFNRLMQNSAPAGMTYNPDSGSYTRTGSAAPTTSISPQMRSSSSSSSSSGGFWKALTGRTFAESVAGGGNTTPSSTPSRAASSPPTRPSSSTSSSTSSSSTSSSTSSGGFWKALTGKTFKETLGID